MAEDWLLEIMRNVTKSAYKVFDEHPELGITKEEYRQNLKKTHPEWIPDLAKEEKQ